MTDEEFDAWARNVAMLAVNEEEAEAFCAEARRAREAEAALRAHLEAAQAEVTRQAGLLTSYVADHQARAAWRETIVATARAEQREADARIAERFDGARFYEHPTACDLQAAEIAAAIRNQK